MSSYMVLAAVSDALRELVWEAIEQDPTLHAHVGTRQAIVFRNPKKTAEDSANRLSFWLYRVAEDEFMKNQPPARSGIARAGGEDTGARQSSRFPPLALNLFYLITPFSPTAEFEYLLLGKTMQVMYDNAIVVLRDEPNEIFEELRIILCRLALDEVSRVWEALQEPYRLSVCYQVRVTSIDSTRTLDRTRVIERTANYTGVA